MALGDGKIAKPSNGNGSKKVSKKDPEQLGIHLDTVAEEKLSKNKLTGVVIDGKTYTCATCKSGHRVGVCKHANDRPMKPTHAPGRPAAGQPKKVVCDCPKDCKCTKKDCKCPRNCLCTQEMYMLVYIPCPDADSDGKWEVDYPVVTDLKGNVLTKEQAEERQKQKETLQPHSPSAAKPEATGGCCKHLKVVQEAVVNANKNGCNCGRACQCAFCPQHPNNMTSQDLMRKQANFISQQQLPHSIEFTRFDTGVPQEMSCMGGAPQFAYMRNATNASLSAFSEAFPSRGQNGYMLAYPIRREHTPMPEPTQPEQDPAQLTPFDFNYVLGDAMVANDGPNGWQGQGLNDDGQWSLPTLPTDQNFVEGLTNIFPSLNVPLEHIVSPPPDMSMQSSMLSPSMPDATGLPLSPGAFDLQPHGIDPSFINQRRATVIPSPMTTGGAFTPAMRQTSLTPGVLPAEGQYFDPRQFQSEVDFSDFTNII